MVPNNFSKITADAGYGSEENYQWLENKRITAYMKHNYFDRNQKASRRDPFVTENSRYDVKKKRYYCPIGKTMKKIGTRTETNRTGYLQQLTFIGRKDVTDVRYR